MAAAVAFRWALPPGRSLLPLLLLLSAVAPLFGLCSAAGNGAAGSCPLSSGRHAGHSDHHHHHHDHDHGPGGCGHHHHHGHGHNHGLRPGHHEHRRRKLPEELAEEEDLALEKFGDAHFLDGFHVHDGFLGDGAAHKMSTRGLWLRAMGCSLLVSMASLICLIILPLFFLNGKPSKLVVDSLAVFGAGAMLGDAFLHQLPHAFGGGHSHGHDHHMDNIDHTDGRSHSHSLEDLSTGLSILAGILLFLIIEKIVRYIEDASKNGRLAIGHHHYHHHKNHNKKDDETCESHMSSDLNEKSSEQMLDTEQKSRVSDDNLKVGEQSSQETPVRKRRSTTSNTSDSQNVTTTNGSIKEKAPSTETSPNSKSSLVFGYLNLFSDGVHNFTDGMALGSAFLLYGSVGGWSRTLFLLAHELPQEVGDFGILVRSGFSVFKALFFNFLSALVALAGTALALFMGKDPGHSSLIEGFTAGGFIYIAVAGVLPEMNNGSTSIKSTVIQLTCFVVGMAVALCISLVE